MKHLTRENHNEIGAMLKSYERELLALRQQMCDAYGRSSPEVRAIDEIKKRTLALRSSLDVRVCALDPDPSAVRVYFGAWSATRTAL